MKIVEGINLINLPKSRYGIQHEGFVIDLGTDRDDAIIQIFERFPERERYVKLFCVTPQNEILERSQLPGRRFNVIYATDRYAALAINRRRNR